MQIFLVNKKIFVSLATNFNLSQYNQIDSMLVDQVRFVHVFNEVRMGTEMAGRKDVENAKSFDDVHLHVGDHFFPQEDKDEQQENDVQRELQIMDQ